MRLAIVHYHLRPGGVSRVIANAVNALSPHGVDIVVLSGEAPQKPLTPHARHRVVDGLGYDAAGEGAAPARLVEGLARAATDALGATPDLWHVHNHALGKNLGMTRASHQLAAEGNRVLFQMHDFAEDGRPALYRRLLAEVGGGDPERLAAILYPQASHVHYAVLNGRDYGFLKRAGIPEPHLHLLPNPVTAEPVRNRPVDHNRRRLFVYPTRAIRRKNIGEFLLWSAVSGVGDRFAVTLAPQNPVARPIYDRWVQFAREQQLPVEFEAGLRTSFEELAACATAQVTTSVAEGFGLAFLEPWLSECPVTGRNLPEITSDFQQAGVDLSGLYERVVIPLDWIGRETFRDTLQTGLARYYRAYGRALTGSDVDAALSAAVHGERLDFGRLDEPLQERVLTRLASDPAARKEVDPPQLLGPVSGDAQLAANQTVIRRRFGLQAYGRSLQDIYRGIRAAPSSLSLQRPSGASLLNAFLAPSRFYLLRT